MESVVSRIGRPKETDGNGNRDNGGSFLGTSESQRAQYKADEKTAQISQKNGCWIEVVAQEAEDGAGERDGHHRQQGGSV